MSRRQTKRRSTPSGVASGRQRWAEPYLIVTALVLPLVYSNATIDPVLLPGFLVACILWIVLATVSEVGLARSSAPLSIGVGEGIVLGCLVALILVATISMFVSGPTPDGVFELLRLSFFAWSIHASSRALAAERDTLSRLVQSVVVAVFIVGGFAILQYYQIAIFEWMERDTTVDSTMSHRNLLASFLVLALPFVVYGFLGLDKGWRIASAVTLGISIFLLVVLQTRSVWVAFPVGLVLSTGILALVSRRRAAAVPWRPMRRRVVQGAVVVAVGLGLAVLFSSQPTARAPMVEHVGSIVQARDASIQERLQLWSRTLRMIRDHPLLGVGPGNWRVTIPTYGAEGLRSETGTLHFQRPHNDFLWVASETGVLGGLLYVGMFAIVLGLAVAAMARAPSLYERIVLALMIFGVTAYGVDSLFSFPMERIVHPAYLALMIGTVLAVSRGLGESRAWSLSRRLTIAVRVLVGVTALFAGRVAVARLGAEVHLRRALEARAARNWPSMVTELDRIDGRYYAMDPSSAPVAWYRGVAHFEMGDTTAAWADFRRALAVHPNHVHVLNNIASCQALRGESEAAIHTYERAIQLAPRFEEARVNLGAVLHDLGRDREAYDVLAPAVEYATSPRFRQCIGAVKSALGMEN